MIKVSNLQRGNKILDLLSNSTWSFDSNITSDYEIGNFTSILFLSLKFHVSKPEYIYKRIGRMRKTKLQVLIILLDVANFNTVLEEIFRTIRITIILCKNYDECCRYLKGFDLCSKRTSEVLRKKESSVDNFLEAFPKVNKSNSESIQSAFTNIQDFMRCDEKNLSNLFGIGKEKAKTLKTYFNKPFKE